MVAPSAKHIVVIGAGAAGLMAAHELSRAGCKVTILEAQDRCGGRILPLSEAQFGYPAEGAAEFIHGEAPVTRALMHEAGLSLLPINGTRWTSENGTFSDQERDAFDEPALHHALKTLQHDLPLAEFLRRHFSGPAHARMRASIQRMVEGYDAADPERISTFAIRDEWMTGDHATGGRVDGGYGRLIGFLVARCRDHGVDIRTAAVVTAIETVDGGVTVRCADGAAHEGDAAILTVPIPLLPTIAVPAATQPIVNDTVRKGFGNVIKVLLKFERRWWADDPRLRDMTFLLSDDTGAAFRVWWTQFPDESPVLTGWLGGPTTQALADCDEDQLVAAAVASLASIFKRPVADLRQQLVSARAFDWSKHPFARGAYSYAVPEPHDASTTPESGPVYLAGEALYRGRDMGTVEAALASGLHTAKVILKSRS
ncbi:MAG: NAD(P)/FAD-dependent oxidoreductase [Tardiphaga sp.]